MIFFEYVIRNKESIYNQEAFKEAFGECMTASSSDIFLFLEKLIRKEERQKYWEWVEKARSGQKEIFSENFVSCSNRGFQINIVPCFNGTKLDRYVGYIDPK